MENEKPKVEWVPPVNVREYFERGYYFRRRFKKGREYIFLRRGDREISLGPADADKLSYLAELEKEFPRKFPVPQGV